MKMETPPLASFTKSEKRLGLLGLALCAWALVIVLRLFQLQIVRHEKFSRLAEAQQEKFEQVQAPRGAIYDRNGNYLAISSDVPIICVNPLRIPDKETAAGLLAGVLKLNRQDVLNDLLRAAISHRGYLVVDPTPSENEVDAVRKLNLDWIDIRKGSGRTYPNGQLAAHVIGNVDAEGHGVAGVERKLNSFLAGAPGLLRVTTDVHRRGYNFEVERAPSIGKDVTLTIDSRLQYVAEQALAEAVTKNHGDRGSLIAMNPYTGEVLALANYPTYNPNERLKSGKKPVGREDYAVVAPFEPGSVFKVITLSAALETTNLRPESVINCGNGILRIGSRIIHDHKSYPALPMQDVLAFSSNIGAIRIGMQVGNSRMYDYIKRFGFGRRTGIELPAEAPGLIRPLSRWKPASIGSVAMGHEISVTSVQLAQAGAVIANGGFLVHPHLVLSEQAPGGQKVKMQFPKPVRVLSPKAVITMRQMMERVVTTQGGTGRRAHITGYSTAGKTGTAQIFDAEHHIYTHHYNASFLGFAPVVNPSVVVVVTVSGTTGQAGYGGQASAPAFKATAGEALRLLGVPRDLPADLDEKQENEPDKKDKKIDDDLSIADLSEPLSLQDMQQALGDSSEDGAAQVVSVNTVDGPTAPDFIGKTIKDVVEQAAEQGVTVETKGNGLARVQRPGPGEPLPPGERIRVLFMR
jgi:cell division protein FtsI (penicillin-binding protein 3)